VTNRLGPLLARLIVRGLPGPCQVLARAWAWLAAETSDLEEERPQLSSAKTRQAQTRHITLAVQRGWGRARVVEDDPCGLLSGAARSRTGCRPSCGGTAIAPRRHRQDTLPRLEHPLQLPRYARRSLLCARSPSLRHAQVGRQRRSVELSFGLRPVGALARRRKESPKKSVPRKDGGRQ
jgi:hypothetical protein